MHTREVSEVGVPRLVQLELGGVVQVIGGMTRDYLAAKARVIVATIVPDINDSASEVVVNFLNCGWHAHGPAYSSLLHPTK